MARRKHRAAIRKPSKRPRRAPKKALPRLPRRQLTLPAGYRADRTGVATLREVLSPQIPTIDGGNLTDEDRARLTMLRIEAQPHFDIVGPGFVLNKDRALDEVQRGTALGQILVAVEHRTIEFLREAAAVHRRRRQTQSRARKRARAKPRRNGR